MLSKIPSPKRTAQAAFTLLEIMIALAILGLLVGLSVSKISGILDHGRIDTAKLFVTASLKTTLQKYSIDMGHFPTTTEGLEVLRTAPSGTGSRWHGPYVEEDIAWPPLDPWGEPYQYKSPGTHNPKLYDLWSKGPDATDGTADDIGNWQPAATEETGTSN